ncbi:DUF2285 domain-containing protein [Chelatococcus reniformis]|uniref:T6SS Transcription factor RovC-like DNA binding domain-containing protein n=1 Tax=Chelatococcus reniformis TaxID=1494448 RepID=A0A916UYK2_9HYPH|nr:DUF2285 domain-containing protein [Chelatococcus reniformis]GGC94236.1 hypothetical protein GCM10010994_60030 [Chelatococcus reniformis]
MNWSELPVDIRRTPDGHCMLLRLGGVEHRALFRDKPVAGMRYAAALPFDEAFDIRVHAARRLWCALDGRPPGPIFRSLPRQREQRLALALRALDARLDGATYRTIAEMLFGADRLPSRGWKTHDLHQRTVRLVQLGLRLMGGGYRELLCYPLRRR